MIGVAGEYHNPAMDWRRSDLEAITRAIGAAIHDGSPFSLIRLGDGEGAVLAFDEPEMAADLQGALNIWFGSQSLDDDDLAGIRGQLEHAIATADVLGLPRPLQLQALARYRAVLPATSRICGDSPPIIGDAALHFYLQWSGALAYLLRRIERLTTIGCRDIGAQLADVLDIGIVRSILVRGEHEFPGQIPENHWPDGFRRVMRDLDTIRPGEVVLVGAGVLGKIYCGKVKSSGGIALDLGSIFDGWAGIRSRGERITHSAEYTLQYLADTPPSFADMRARVTKHIAKTNITDGTF